MKIFWLWRETTNTFSAGTRRRFMFKQRYCNVKTLKKQLLKDAVYAGTLTRDKNKEICFNLLVWKLDIFIVLYS